MVTYDLVIRPLVAGEQNLFHALIDAIDPRVYAIERDYDKLCAAGECRPEWTWVALRDEQIVGRAVYWAGPNDTEPLALDWLDFGTDTAVGAALLRAAPFRVEYSIDLRPGWQDEPDLRAAVGARVAAAHAAGMRPLVERLVYRWTPDAGLPERPGRLRFLPEQDDDVLFDVLRRIHVDSLDGHAQQNIRRGGLDAAARSELEFIRWMPSPSQWWRLAYTAGGELVGITVPGRNYVTPIVGFVGVVPEQRGHNYSYELLIECTHILAEEGVTQIQAATDATNHPMAASFARAGYPISVERTTLAWPE